MKMLSWVNRLESTASSLFTAPKLISQVIRDTAISQTAASRALDHMPTDVAALGKLVGEIQYTGTYEPLFVAF